MYCVIWVCDLCFLYLTFRMFTGFVGCECYLWSLFVGFGGLGFGGCFVISIWMLPFISLRYGVILLMSWIGLLRVLVGFVGWFACVYF